MTAKATRAPAILSTRLYVYFSSTEWVQEHADLLARRAVVYLNVDSIYGNASMAATAVPSMYQAATEAAKKIDNPMESEKKAGRNTVYDTWMHTFPGNFPARPDAPKMPVPSGGSDHATFINYLGIPVIDFEYRNTTQFDTYPLYHTLYETHYLNEEILDTNNFAVSALRLLIGGATNISQIFREQLIRMISILQILNAMLANLVEFISPTRAAFIVKRLTPSRHLGARGRRSVLG